ncbi:serine/threonine-protein phosphatase 6 regulatory subunit 3-like isoform X3 [Pomacea canaliculata]|uniref:serine/threonine-protein phosphatase 6 regulatory subunit 3-like isoform X3 n=1 Tax=Pomacea canaliculata TaxID=400727 RepID=UPI000D728C55|nr:serine/threonine-protein phosphatase 6 regulatory subunit 3-like isoform X3 [Pomacea canaliculata]
MFWKFNLLTSSHVDTLLEKEEVTLRELMDEDDILQECKAQNRKLIDFLTQPANMEDMVSMIIREPAVDMEERLRFKYPNTACELLTSDVSQINDKLASDRDLIDKLYYFLEADTPLNPLLASFFSKIMGLLITRKSEMIFEYLKGQKDFVGSLLHHIGTSAIMDLLLRLITCIESPETRRAVIEWLNEQQIVQRLVDCIVPSKDEDVHCNAAQSLCDIVRLGREQIIQLQDTNDPDPLLATMELEETVSKLISNMFDLEENESVIVNGLFVIHTLLEVRRQGPEAVGEHLNMTETEHSQGINNVLAAIKPRLKHFHELLTNPPKQRYSSMPTSVGALEPPLGNARLQVAKLITALVARNTGTINEELVHLKTLHALLDLYFQYTWNNFLHTQVEQCILLILNNPAQEKNNTEDHLLLAQLLTDVKLVQRLLTEWQDNDHQQLHKCFRKTEGGRRKGFMGHLTKMANAVTSAVEKGCNSELIKKYLTDLPEDYKQKWESFVSGTLAEINKKNAIEFRGHPLASSSEDDDSDFKDIPFPQDTAMQQLQQMTSNFIDQFGFNEEEFAEQEDKIDAPFSDRISSINFNIQANEVAHPNSTMFEQACNERIQQFDDDDSDEDIWVEKPLTFDRNAKQTRSGRLQGEAVQVSSSDDSTDSEEELDSPHSIAQQPSSAASSSVSTTATVSVPFITGAAEKMDIDTSEASWPADLTCSQQSSQIESSAMDTGSPWESNSLPAESREGWANFDKSEAQEDSWADFNSFSTITRDNAGPRSSSPVDMDTSENSKGNVYVLNTDSSSTSSCVSGCLEIKVTKHHTEDQCLTNSIKGFHLEMSTPVDSQSPGVPGTDVKLYSTSDGSVKTSEFERIDQEPSGQSAGTAVLSTVKKESTTLCSVDDSNILLASTGMLKKVIDGDEHSSITHSVPGAGDNTHTESDAAQESNSTTGLKIEVLGTYPKEAVEQHDEACQLADGAVPNGPV